MENTKWTIGVGSGNKALLSYSRLDAGGNVVGSPTAFKIKGICYSPCPIGEDNRVGNNLGDYFWDSYKVGQNNEVNIWNWDRLWKPNYDSFGSRNDLDKIKAMGVNTIRVYSMMAYQTDDKGTYFHFDHAYMHKSFLDECYNRGIFVLAGFPLPPAMFFQGDAFEIKKEEWLRNYTETCKQVGSHPAVMGIIFNNELDGAGHSFPQTDADNEAVNYFWSQIEAMSKIAKDNAPNKIVGIALHDAPITYTEKNLPNLNLAAHLDFWGVNTYQTVNLDSVFKSTQATGAIGFNDLSKYTGQYPNVYKPVILTEMGWPSTGHDPSGQIYADQGTEGNTAAFIARMFPLVFQESLCAGVCYFEYCDEWWAQPGLCVWEWNGGAPASSFPNGYWDIEGFGLYGVSMNPGTQIPRKPSGQPINWNQDGNGPYPYFNPLSTRQKPIDALKATYGNIK